MRGRCKLLLDPDPGGKSNISNKLITNILTNLEELKNENIKQYVILLFLEFFTNHYFCSCSSNSNSELQVLVLFLHNADLCAAIKGVGYEMFYLFMFSPLLVKKCVVPAGRGKPLVSGHRGVAVRWSKGGRSTWWQTRANRRNRFTFRY